MIRIRPKFVPFFLVILCFGLFLVGCTLQDEYVEELLAKTKIMSIKNNIENLDSLARSWEQDAYLAGINIAFYGTRDGHISAMYESRNHSAMGYSLVRYNDGQVEKSVGFKYNVNEENKIQKSDIKLDSPDVFRIALSDPRVKVFLNNEVKELCGFMVLEENIAVPQKYYWRINFDDCMDVTESLEIKVDASTGEIIK